MIESAVREDSCIINVSLCDFTEKRVFVQVDQQCSREATGIYKPQCSVHVSRGCRYLQRHSVQITLRFCIATNGSEQICPCPKVEEESQNWFEAIPLVVQV